MLFSLDRLVLWELAVVCAMKRIFTLLLTQHVLKTSARLRRQEPVRPVCKMEAAFVAFWAN